MKNQTDVRKTVETGMDPCLLLKGEFPKKKLFAWYRAS